MNATETIVAGSQRLGSDGDLLPSDGGYSGDGGPATLAQLSYPNGVAVDGQGNIYIADTYNNVIRMVNGVTGYITTVAGNETIGSVFGGGGYSGDGGPATLATLSFPSGVAVDVQGNIYIADTNNNVIRMVTKCAGYITTVAGNYTSTSFVIGGSYNLGGYSGDGGPATLAKLNQPIGIAVDVKGNIYIGDTFNHLIRMVTKSTGYITTVAGNYTITVARNDTIGSSGGGGYSGDGGPATLARLRNPNGVAVDLKGNIYFADSGNDLIRMVTKCTGYITTVAGNLTTEGSVHGGDGGPATLATLNYPSDVDVDVQGSIYIADSFRSAIRMVTKSTGIITTLATFISAPFGIAINIEGHVYTAITFAHIIRMVTLTAPTSMPTTAPTFTPTILPASVCTMPPPPSPRSAKKCVNLRKSTSQSKCKMQNAY